MSGGSFEYLYRKDADDLFASTCTLQEMADELASLGWAEDAAADAYDLLAIVTTQKVRVDAALKRLSGVFKAVEWWRSMDWGEDRVREALAEYRGETPSDVGAQPT